MKTVAIVGTGLVGSGWAIVFANAGLMVRLFDKEPGRAGEAREQIARDLEEMRSYGLCGDPATVLGRITVCVTLEDAVGPADYIQESVLETVPAKATVCLAIDACLQPHAVVGSSSSGIPASAFTAGLTHRERFFVVHPVNPPHLVPLVEIVPSPWSDPTLIAPLRDFLETSGQKPIVVQREVEGFILNRLQGALLNEAWALYEEGYASTTDIDRTIADGLGLRWSFMGPFETIDLNAPGGIADYAARLAPLYRSLARSRGMTAEWPVEAVQRATKERRAALPENNMAARRAWRDQKLMALAAHKRASSR